MDATPPGDERPRGKPLRVRDVADRLGIGRKAVRSLIHAGKIPAVQYGGRTSPWIAFERDVEDYLARTREETEQ